MLQQDALPKPVVLQDEDLEAPAVFMSVAEIRELKLKHILGAFQWTAVNYIMDELEIIP